MRTVNTPVYTSPSALSPECLEVATSMTAWGLGVSVEAYHRASAVGCQSTRTLDGHEQASERTSQDKPSSGVRRRDLHALAIRSVHSVTNQTMRQQCLACQRGTTHMFPGLLALRPGMFSQRGMITLRNTSSFRCAAATSVASTEAAPPRSPRKSFKFWNATKSQRLAGNG